MVYYYQCYNMNGRRIRGHSMGQTTQTTAREYCCLGICLALMGGVTPVSRRLVSDALIYALENTIKALREEIKGQNVMLSAYQISCL